MMTILIITFMIFIISYIFIYPANPKPVLGIYRLPGKWYWLKRAVFYILFNLRSMKKKGNEPDASNNGNYSASEKQIKGYGSGESHSDMERPQALPEDNSIDTTYFGATGKDGTKIVCRLARRNYRRAEIWLFMEIPGIGRLQHPCHPDTDVHYTDGCSFKGGGLHFEILEPMNKWKLSFSGKLRKGLCNDITDKPSEFIETSFSFTWSAFSQPFSFDTDMACSLLGDSIAREEWNKDFFSRLRRKHQTHYEQWGELRGRLNVEGHKEKQVNLQCVRDHTYGLRDWRSFHRYIIHFIYLETGMSIQVGVVSQPDLMSHIKIGYVAYANGDVISVSDVSLNLWDIGETTAMPPSPYSFSFKADGLTYNVAVETGVTPIWYHHEDRGGKVFEAFFTFRVNSKPGRGISEFFYRNSEGPSFTGPALYPLISEPPLSAVEGDKNKITLAFTEDSCQSPSLVGGKGAQLAQLTSIHEQISATVSPGFCLTLKSFELQLQHCPAIEQSIQDISLAAVNHPVNLPSACDTCVELISKTQALDQVQDCVLKSLQSLKGHEYQSTHFAVRSSAAGEDGDEASSAGQMETILGVVGLEQILVSIQRCWASVYAYQAVEYRRRHGQPIRVLVGVVIQEMVPADAAGVLFTAGPVTGSSSLLFINANFGLGESVVSGKADPDTIIIARDPNARVIEADNLSSVLQIKSVTKGEKQLRIVETGHGGLKEEIVEGGSASACISDAVILKLAAIGIELEKMYGSSRDIEWAVVKDEIFLFQCRPITVTSSETEEDLLHEFDSPLTCDYPWLTTGNVSEMMPGAVTPLTLSTFKNAIEYSLQKLNVQIGARRKVTYLPKCLLSFCNHLFIGLTDLSTSLMSSMMVRKDIMEINLLGNTLPEFSVDQIEDYYGRPKERWFTRFLNVTNFMRLFSKAARVTSEWEKKIPVYNVGKTAKTAIQLYESINSQLCDYETVFAWTVINSGRSGNWSSILMSILGGDDVSDWTIDLYGDIALLLSKCDGVYSAEVPRALETLARTISEIEPSITDLFLETPDVECLKIIKKYPELQSKVDLFLQRHGHRCLRESEMREKSWRSAPEKYISVVKTMLKTKCYAKKERETVNISKLLDTLKTKPSMFKRLILRLLLPKAWTAVGAREWGKSVSIQMCEVFKLAYARLSDHMHREGRLPDPDLIYFLTHQEIGHLLGSESSKLIIRAEKRRKILVKQQMQRFEKMSQSRPVPIDSSKPQVTPQCLERLQGMPVSQGEVTGTARVVHSLEQASIIQAGDILVVRSTDVGWTPYFPLIGGLVTELGGLISHGAVVAREYGIPCIVNVSNATSHLKSGEKVKIDGLLGLVERLET